MTINCMKHYYESEVFNRSDMMNLSTEQKHVKLQFQISKIQKQKVELM